MALRLQQLPITASEHPVLFTKEAVLWLDRFTGAMTEISSRARPSRPTLARTARAMVRSMNCSSRLERRPA